jgi:hypothetical protein
LEAHIKCQSHTKKNVIIPQRSADFLLNKIQKQKNGQWQLEGALSFHILKHYSGDNYRLHSILSLSKSSHPRFTCETKLTPFCTSCFYLSPGGSFVALHHLINDFSRTLSLRSSPVPSPSISSRRLITSSVIKIQRKDVNYTNYRKRGGNECSH